MSKYLAMSLGLFLLLAAPLVANDVSVTGDYIEVRTADVYTGPCFANGEVNLTGKEAILAWRVNNGAWNGVSLNGLSVVAVVKANATLGDPHARPFPTRSVMVVDETANPEQRLALLDLAKSASKGLVDEVVKVVAAPIDMKVMARPGFASLKAGNLAELKTRALMHHDVHCGNEEVYYPPLTEIAGATPAFTLVHRFEGEGLNSVWSSPSKRSAFIGTFAR